jgi:hypothetical protein
LGDGERQDFCFSACFYFSPRPQVSCLAIFLLKKTFSLTKLVCLANFIYVQSFSFGGLFFVFILDEIIVSVLFCSVFVNYSA